MLVVHPYQSANAWPPIVSAVHAGATVVKIAGRYHVTLRQQNFSGNVLRRFPRNGLHYWTLLRSA